jgi:hypothetical protein
MGVNNSMRRGKIRNDDQANWGAAWVPFPGDVAYVWHGALHATTVAESLVRHGFSIRAQIIWVKERLVIGRGDYHWMHEPCWYESPSGYPVQSPYVAIANRQAEIMMRIASEFGFTPASRVRLWMVSNIPSGLWDLEDVDDGTAKW